MTSSHRERPVVLLHGWPVTPAHWRGLTPRLREEGFVPVPVTLPGLGAPPVGAGSYRKSELAARVGEQLAGQGFTRFAVVGHDWGGTVAVLLAAAMPGTVEALVIEEEILPGIGVEIPDPGAGYYPAWHGPFNRVPGLAEQLVPGRESAYYGAFLRESAGPAGIGPAELRRYIDAYRTPGVLEAGLGYYRTREEDSRDVDRLREHPIHTPVLAIGGRYAMGAAVAEGLRVVGTDVSGVILERSGHYPVEQEPGPAADAVIAFLRRGG